MLNPTFLRILVATGPEEKARVLRWSEDFSKDGCERGESMPFRPFTDEDRRKATLARALMSPEHRKAIARRAAYRRWYRVYADDEVRVNNHLKLLAEIVGNSLANDDIDRVIQAERAMAPYERLKITLRMGREKDVDGTAQTLDPDQLQALDRLQKNRDLREKRMSSDITDVTPTTVEPAPK